ncbi:hypothetical protein, partial [Microvirga tunisiensis]|uniref:hypothetical protein n=1 Tax=Microvirga tunisiensis TaxID=2108360 RepID=UPI001AEF008F
GECGTGQLVAGISLNNQILRCFKCLSYTRQPSSTFPCIRTARRILVKPRSVVGLGALFGNRADPEGEACLTKFLEAQMAALSIKELEEQAGYESLLVRSAWYVLAKRRWNALGVEVRASIDDQYKAEFRADIERLTSFRPQTANV